MKVRILGCGTSSGVPRIGNDWGDCDPTDPRNRRSRASILVESATTRLIVDTSPDMRQQLLDADIVAIDAILWTHDHADHCHGIDDVRQIFHARRAPVPGYAYIEAMKQLQRRFDYVFAGREGYPSTVEPRVLEADMMVGDIRVRCTAQPHGSIFSAGLRFDHDGRSIGYSTDFHEYTDDMLDLFAGVDLWIVDALRERPHPTHAHLGLTLDAIRTCRPGRALLTHMDQSMDYARLAERLPDGVQPAHDGLEVVL